MNTVGDDIEDLKRQHPTAAHSEAVGAQLVDGVYLPAGETHLVEHMTQNRRLVDGKGSYQYKKFEAALRLIPANRRRVALDIGAHVGLWSMQLVKFFAQVYAFEPVPRLRELFEANLAVDGGVNPKVRMHACALGNDRGTVDIQVPAETTGNSHVAISGPHPGTRGIAHPDRIDLVRDVPMARLDDLGIRDVGFVKIDVEGFEKQVLLGGEKTIRRDLPIIVVEQKGNEVAYGDQPRAAVELLRRWGGEVKAEIGGDFIVEFCKPCAKTREAWDKMAQAVRR